MNEETALPSAHEREQTAQALRRKLCVISGAEITLRTTTKVRIRAKRLSGRQGQSAKEIAETEEFGDLVEFWIQNVNFSFSPHGNIAVPLHVAQMHKLIIIEDAPADNLFTKCRVLNIEPEDRDRVIFEIGEVTAQMLERCEMPIVELVFAQAKIIHNMTRKAQADDKH
tara:strand:+ start:1587 stop:2093 length:507 start_codon:yes stop_codon:yes gene_type:complete